MSTVTCPEHIREEHRAELELRDLKKTVAELKARCDRLEHRIGDLELHAETLEDRLSRHQGRSER